MHMIHDVYKISAAMRSGGLHRYGICKNCVATAKNADHSASASRSGVVRRIGGDLVPRKCHAVSYATNASVAGAADI